MLHTFVQRPFALVVVCFFSYVHRNLQLSVCLFVVFVFVGTLALRSANVTSGDRRYLSFIVASWYFYVFASAHQFLR